MYRRRNLVTFSSVTIQWRVPGDGRRTIYAYPSKWGIFVKPTLQALVLADHIYRDGETGKNVIAGTFNQVTLHVREVREAVAENGTQQKVQVIGPQAGSPHLYVSLTNVRGQFELALRFVNLNDNRALFEWKFLVASDDPLRTIEKIIKLPMLPFPESGIYALELLYSDDPLGCLRIIANKAPQPNEESK